MTDQQQDLAEIHLQDPLVKCFLELTSLKKEPVVISELIPHLPKNKRKLTPYLLINAAQNVKYEGQLHKKKLTKLWNLTCPAILLLNDDQACLITEINKKSQTAIVKLLNGSDEEQEILIDELEDQYAGYIITFRHQYAFEKRADEQGLFENKKSWFWDTLFQYKSFYYNMLIAALFVNLFALAMPLFIMNVYDRVIPNNAMVTLWTLAAGVIVVLIADFVLKTLRSLFVDVANKKIDILLSSRLLDKSLSIKMKNQPASTGVRANHLREFETVREFFGSATLAGVIDIPFLFIFIAVIGMIGGPLFLVPIIFGAISIISAVLLSVPVFYYTKQTFVGGAQKTAILFESLSAVEAIKASLATQQILHRWRSLTASVASSMLKSKFYSSLASNVTAFCNIAANIVVVIWGVYLIRDGEITTGALIATVILSGRTLAPLARVTGLLTRYQQTKCSFTELNNLMGTEEDRPVEKEFLPKTDIDGAIKLDNVSFHYPSQAVDFIKNVSLEIKPGEHVAILGNSGSGKTTLLKLILGFYEPNAGEIFIDDIHQEQIDPELYRKHIGYLEQSPKLLFGTAASNIMLKAPWVTAEQVVKASQISCADAFLRVHPQGYQMAVGENGNGLSGGQVQMVALARALLDDPNILLFDEPTSSMDNAAEVNFLKNLKSYADGKTMIVNTHRKSVLALVDRIIVMKDGQVVLNDDRDTVLKELDKQGGSK